MMRGKGLYFKKNKYTLLALIVSLVIIFYFYAQILYPIIDGNLNFFYGDFSTRITPNNESLGRNYFLYTFNAHSGSAEIESNRFFLLGGGITLLFGYLNPSYSQIHSIILLISMLLGSFGLFRITGIFEKNDFHRSIIILPVMLFYYLNLWAVVRLGHFWIWTAYAALPIFLWFGLSYVLEKKNSYIILYSVVYAIFGTIPHAFLFFSVIHLFLIVFSLVRKDKVKNILILSSLPLFIFLLLNLPLLLPYSGITYPLGITLDQLIMLSNNGNLINTLTSSNIWWPQVPPETIFDNWAFRLSSLGITILIFHTLLVSKRLNKNELKIAILSSIFFFGILFVTLGTNNPLITGILQLLSEYRLLDLVAPIREWSRISILFPIFLVLIFIVCSTKLKKIEKITVYIFIILVGINIISSPAYTHLNEVYSPVDIPQEYYNLSRDLPLDHKILYVDPSQADNILGTWRYAWNSNKAASSVLEFSIGSTYPAASDFSVLMKNKELPQTLLKAFNVKYVLLRTDILGATDFELEYRDLNLTKFNYLTLLENQDDVKPFLIYSSGILVDDNGKDIYSLANVMSSPLIAPVKSSANDTTFALYDFSSYALYQELTQVGKSIIITPFDFSFRYDPSAVWSKATTKDVLHTEWHIFFDAFKIENWQTDYGRGLVFTWANSSNENDLRMTFEVKNASDYHLLTRYFENAMGGPLQVFLDNIEISINSSSQLNRFVWRDLGEYPLETGTHSIILRNIDGFNAINLLSLVQSQDLSNIENGIEDMLKNKTMVYIFEAESDLYYENAKVLKSLNASFGEVLAFTTGSAWQDIEILNNGSYMIAINLNGEFNVKVDNFTYPISSDSSVFKYIGPINLAKGIHNIQVEPANVLISLSGNQTDVEEWKLFTPEDQWGSIYRISWDQSESALRAELFNSTWGWKTINSPTFPVKYNTTYQLMFSIKADNGSEVHYKIYEYDSSMQYVNSNYIYVGDGTFDWVNASYKFQPSDPSVSYVQLQVWHGNETTKGLPNIIWIKDVAIYGKSNQLDVIWAYSLSSSLSNSTLESLFATDGMPAIIKNYTRVNPALWELELDSSKPFILSLAEAYDPSWEARVYRDGILVERAQPIELYNFINGFRLNTTGTDLKVQIVYIQQERFDVGLLFTGLTFASILFIMFYDWRRARELKGPILPSEYGK